MYLVGSYQTTYEKGDSMQTRTIIKALRGRVFDPAYTKALSDAYTEDVDNGDFKIPEDEYAAAEVALQTGLSDEQKELLKAMELRHNENRQYAIEYAFCCGVLGAFEQYFAPDDRPRFEYSNSVVRGLFEIPGMERHLKYHENNRHNLESFESLEDALGEDMSYHIVSVNCAWSERVNHGAVSSYYCGYRAAIALIEEVISLGTAHMMEKILMTEYKLGFTTPYWHREMANGREQRAQNEPEQKGA